MRGKRGRKRDQRGASPHQLPNLTLSVRGIPRLSFGKNRCALELAAYCRALGRKHPRKPQTARAKLRDARQYPPSCVQALPDPGCRASAELMARCKWGYPAVIGPEARAAAARTIKERCHLWPAESHT